MIIFIHKKAVLLMFTGLIFVGISWGAYNFALHPHMHIWKNQKVVITDVATSEKMVALTFDDGPHPDYTPLILDVLKKYDAKGTFFVLGSRCEKYPDIIKRMAKEGHEVGNHSYSHRNFSKKHSVDTMFEEIHRTDDIILRLAGQKSPLIRPPGGFLSDAFIARIKNEKRTIAYWSYIQDTKDWKGKKAEAIAGHIVKNIKPGQIIILHDGADTGMETARAVNLIADRLTRAGYQLVTVSELIKSGNK